MNTRAVIQMPTTARRGEVLAVRALIAHVMESGHRPDGLGGTLPRDIIRRFECRCDGEMVFAADLFQAVAANPLIQFHTVALATGTYVFQWRGDNGFSHTERVVLTVA